MERGDGLWLGKEPNLATTRRRHWGCGPSFGNERVLGRLNGSLEAFFAENMKVEHCHFMPGREKNRASCQGNIVHAATTHQTVLCKRRGIDPDAAMRGSPELQGGT